MISPCWIKEMQLNFDQKIDGECSNKVDALLTFDVGAI
jgi:hypothetical protein